LALTLVATSASANTLLANGGFERAVSGNPLVASDNSSIISWATKREGVEGFAPAVYGGEARKGAGDVDLEGYMSWVAPGFAIEPTVAAKMGWADALTFKGDASGLPEPSTWALMLVSFGMAGAALRRRGRSERYRLVEYLGEGATTTEDFDAPSDATALRRVESVATGDFKLWRGDVLIFG